MKPKLALLIPTFIGREHYLKRLLDILMPQVEKYKDDVIMLILNDNRSVTTGWKRNKLTEMAMEAGATHRAFIDCDDTVTEDYLDLNMPGVYENFDCNTLLGIYSVNGAVNPKKHIFTHSLKYDHWFEDETTYYRNPNHLNVIKLLLIADIKFPDISWGEDGRWAESLYASGVLKTEYIIQRPFYNYLARTKTDGI